MTLRSPTVSTPRITMYVSLDECMHEHDLSVQGVESPNFKKCRRVSIAVEALLQRGPGGPKLPDEAYGPVQVLNDVTVASMTPPVHLGSKTSQEADDNHTKALHFGVVERCQKTRFPNPSLYLIYACNNRILKPSITIAYLAVHQMCPTLQHLQSSVTTKT